MAITNLCGFEAGDGTENIFFAGTASVQSGIKRTGGYAFRSNPTTTAIGCEDIPVQLAADGSGDSTTNVSTIYGAFYFSPATLPAANNEEIAALLTSGANYKFAIRIDSTGHLMLFDSAGNQIGSTGSIALATDGTWYLIEFYGESNASTATVTLKLNGTQEISGTGNTSATGYNRIRIGKATNRNGNTVDFYYDDLVFDLADYPGAGKVEVMQADGDGTYTAWTIGGGSGADWQQVDEIPADNTTFLLSTLVVDDASSVTLESTSSAGISGNVRAVKAFAAVARNASGAKGVRVRLRSGTTDSDTTSNYSAPSAIVQIGKVFTTNPATSGTWSLSALDNIEVGIVEKVTTVQTRCSVLGAMVLFSPVTTVTVAPDPALAVATSVAPTFIAGSITITPAPAECVTTSIDPAVILPPLVITPAPAEVVATASGAVIPLVIAPPPASCRATTIDPTYAVTVRVSVITGSDDAHQLANGSGFKTNANRLELVASAVTKTRSHAGIRFQNVLLPKGATVQNARLYLYNNSAYDDPRCDIYCQAIDNAPTFSAASTILTRSKTTASTSWQQDNLGTGRKYSANFNTAVQEVIDRAGWSSGNSLAVILWATSDAIKRYYPTSFDGRQAPQLVVTYVPPAVPAVVITPVAAKAVASTRDPIIIIVGNLIITPGPIGVIPTTVNPTVVQSSVTITPDPATAVALVNGPDLAWKVTYTPNPAVAVASTANPEVLIETEGFWWTPEPATAVAATVDPRITDVVIQPDPATAVASTVDPVTTAPLVLEVDPAFAVASVGFGEVTVTTDPATAVASTENPTVVLGSITITPAPAVAVASTVNPTVVQTSISVTPDPVSAVASTVDPTVVYGSISIMPSASFAVASTVDPTVFQSSATITPSSAEAVATTSDPTVLYGSLHITPEVSYAIASTINPTISIITRASPVDLTLYDRSFELDVRDRDLALSIQDRDLELTLIGR